MPSLNVTDLEVPYGLNRDGLLVPAWRASLDERYTCPACTGELVHRPAYRRAPAHFVHHPPAYCHADWLTHATARRLLVQAIRENASGRPLSIRAECTECGAVGPQVIRGGAFTEARGEATLGQFTCDVVGCDSGGVRLCLRVLHAHAFRADDRRAAELPYPWAELLAMDVMEDPFNWRPVRYGRLKAQRCARCEERELEVRAVADCWGIPRELYSVGRRPGREPYVAATGPCWRCHATIPLFWWRGVPFCEEAPPEPRPATVQKLYSERHGRSYWANTCPQCRNVQDDNRVFLHKGPLSGLPLDWSRLLTALEPSDVFRAVIRRSLGG